MVKMLILKPQDKVICVYFDKTAVGIVKNKVCRQRDGMPSVPRKEPEYMIWWDKLQAFCPVFVSDLIKIIEIW